MKPEKIRLLFADDDPVFRAGIKTTLESADDLVFVGEATDGHETQRLCRELTPDVLLLDLKMPGPSAVETIRSVQAHCPEMKIVILSAYAAGDQVREVTALGIAGYAIKGEPVEALVEAIRTAAQGGMWFSQAVIEKLIPPRGESLERLSTLTKRERQVLELMAQGWDSDGIAKELNLTLQTVYNYASRIYEKLNVKTRAEAIIMGREHMLGKD